MLLTCPATLVVYIVLNYWKDLIVKCVKNKHKWWLYKQKHAALSQSVENASWHVILGAQSFWKLEVEDKPLRQDTILQKSHWWQILCELIISRSKKPPLYGSTSLSTPPPKWLKVDFCQIKLFQQRRSTYRSLYSLSCHRMSQYFFCVASNNLVVWSFAMLMFALPDNSQTAQLFL